MVNTLVRNSTENIGVLLEELDRMKAQINSSATELDMVKHEVMDIMQKSAVSEHFANSILNIIQEKTEILEILQASLGNFFTILY